MSACSFIGTLLSITKINQKNCHALQDIWLLGRDNTAQCGLWKYEILMCCKNRQVSIQPVLESKEAHGKCIRKKKIPLNWILKNKKELARKNAGFVSFICFFLGRKTKEVLRWNNTRKRRREQETTLVYRVCIIRSEFGEHKVKSRGWMSRGLGR